LPHHIAGLANRKMRLSYGPYEREGSKVSTNKTRLQVLWNAKARVPGITADLYETSYSLYKKFLINYEGASFPPAGSLVNYDLGWELVKSSPSATDLMDSLDLWSKHHNLDADWSRRWAVRAMQAWTHDKEALQFLSWCQFPSTVRYILFPQFYQENIFDAKIRSTCLRVVRVLSIG
jgi:hypothetical protein